MRTFIRVEVYDYENDKSKSGFVSITDLIIRQVLNVPFETSDEELAKIIIESKDPTVMELNALLLGVLKDLPKPDVFTSDRENKYCLFTEDAYDARVDSFELLNDIIQDFFPSYNLVMLEFDLPEEAILYEDEYQVVISKADYETYRPEYHWAISSEV